MPTGVGEGLDVEGGGVIRAVYVPAVLGGENGKERVFRRIVGVASTLSASSS